MAAEGGARGVPAAPGALPFVDLVGEHAEVAAEVRAGWDRVLASGRFLGGQETAGFEAQFARFCGRASCVTVASGSDALELALRAVGAGAGDGDGDEVIVPAATFVSTALAVVRTGARPVVVDVDEQTSLIDPAAVAAAVTSRTRAVVGVDLYGQLAPYEQLAAAVAAGDIALVEDAAQSHGASRNGRPIGATATVTSTSFYPTKNLGAYGHAGAVLTDVPGIAETVRILRSYGSDRKYHHPVVGWNLQIDELQAVVLAAKLPGLAARNAQRRAAAARYDALLADEPRITRPSVLAGNEHAWHLYVIRVRDRDAVLARLQHEGIAAAVHYPLPLHLHGALSHLGYGPGDFPVAEAPLKPCCPCPCILGSRLPSRSRWWPPWGGRSVGDQAALRKAIRSRPTTLPSRWSRCRPTATVVAV